MTQNNRRFLIIALVPVLISLTIGTAHAAGVFDTVANTFKSLESTWYGRLIGDAKDLFWALAGIEFAWLGAQWMLARRTFDEIVPSLLKKVLVIGFFLAILLNANTWVTAIINSFQDAGAQAGGLGALSPSTIMSYGISDAWSLLTGVSLSGGGGGGGGGGFFSGMIHAVKAVVDPAMWLEVIERVLLAVFLLLAFFAIAVEMLVTLIESYLVLGGGVLFLAFGGSRWTTRFADGYINNAVAIGVKLFTIYLIVGGLTTSVIPQMNAQLNSMGNNGNLLSGLTAVIVMLAAAMITKRVPEKAASFLGAGISMTSGALGAEVGKVGAAAVGVGAAIASGGTAAAAGGASMLAGGAGSAAAGAGMAGAQASTLGGAAATGAAGAGGGVAASSGAAGVAAPSAGSTQLASAAGAGPGPAAATPGAPAPAPVSAGSGPAQATPSPSAPADAGQAAGSSPAQSPPPAQTRTGQRLQDTLRSMQQAARGVHGASHGSHSGVQASHISTSHGNDA